MVKFSEEAKSLHASDIREILKVTENPGKLFPSPVAFLHRETLPD